MKKCNELVKVVLSMLYAIVCSADVYGMQPVPYYSIRPQGVDAARELAGWTQSINQYDYGCVYGSLSLTGQYSRSFNGVNIANSLGFSAPTQECGLSFFSVKGSASNPRSPFNWLAENLYLSPNFAGLEQLEPLIENVVVDLDYYMGLDTLLKGLFFRINAPINFSRWNLRNVGGGSSQTSGYEPGNFNAAGVDVSQLLTSIDEYFNGKAPMNIPGAIFNPLCYSKMSSPCSQNNSVTRLAELQMIVGWNFFERENGHVGVGVLMRAPTGNRPKAEFIFEPISGNGGHWELGAHITSHYIFWQCENDTLGFYIDANITHLFNARQTRTFDLVDKPLSRYMLASKLGQPVVNLLGSNSIDGPGTTIPNAQFQYEFSPVANLTTRSLKVSAAVQADIAAQFTYAAGDGFTFDVGYNFWVRSCDTFSFDSCATSSACGSSCNNSMTCSSPACAVSYAPSTWALKGDAYVVGFGALGPVPLSASESQATIYSGTNFPTTQVPVDADSSTYFTALETNVGIDNRQYAFQSNGSALFGVISPAAGAAPIGTSVNPVFIRESDINFAGTRGLSHKIYAHMSYVGKESLCGQPFIGLGGFGEFGMNQSPCTSSSSCAVSCPASCTDSCSTTNCVSNVVSCNTVSLSQWGVWIKMGVTF